jgi:hypothetical protein
MAVGSERGSANRARSRGRASTNGSGAPSGSSRTREVSSGQSRSRQSTRSSGQRTQRAQSRSSSSGSRSAPATGRRTSRGGGTTSARGRSQSAQGTRGTIASIGIPVVTGAVGIAGGVLLGRTALQRDKRFLGISLPIKVDLSDVTQQIGEAGRQLGKLANEVKTVREKAEQVGRAIS